MDIFQIVESPSQESTLDRVSQGKRDDRLPREPSFQAARHKSPSAILASVRPTESKFGKIAIPQLRNALEEKRCRIFHACKSCQEYKMKCDGAQPYCKRCVTSGKQCSYRPRKHQRMKEWEIPHSTSRFPSDKAIQSAQRAICGIRWL